jgi:type II secretory pathway predicted ATPase ExeA
MNPALEPSLTPTQQAALAKVACVCRLPGGVAVLCGPPGTGTSLVLARLAAHVAAEGRRIEQRSIRGWESEATDERHPLADVAVADDAHLASPDALVKLLERCRDRRPVAALVLAGQGRLLTLLARDSRLESAVTLRATLRPCGLDDSRTIMSALARTATFDDEAVDAIHEIAAGIPAAIGRLVALADIVAASRSNSRVAANDVEEIHRRLSPLAA